MRRTISALLCVSIAGCATQPTNIPPAYVSEAPYRNYDCETLTRELEKSGSAVTSISQAQRRSATADAAWFWVGMLVTWPAMFGLLATSDHEDELARVKGEQSALAIVEAEKCHPSSTKAVTG